MEFVFPVGNACLFIGRKGKWEVRLEAESQRVVSRSSLAKHQNGSQIISGEENLK